MSKMFFGFGDKSGTIIRLDRVNAVRELRHKFGYSIALTMQGNDQEVIVSYGEDKELRDGNLRNLWLEWQQLEY